MVVGRCIVERDWVSHKALCQLKQSVVGKMEMSMNLKGVLGASTGLSTGEWVVLKDFSGRPQRSQRI